MPGKLFMILTCFCAVAAAQPQNVAVGWSSTESSGAGMSGGGSNVQSSAGDPWGGAASGAGNAGVQGGFFANPAAQGPVTTVDETPDVPLEFSLEQNYPNPFNPATTILFTLPRASRTSLVIYNVLGQEIARPVDEWREAGSHAVRIDASGWTSGVYFYDLRSDGAGLTRKMMLIR